MKDCTSYNPNVVLGGNNLAPNESNLSLATSVKTGTVIFDYFMFLLDRDNQGDALVLKQKIEIFYEGR